MADEVLVWCDVRKNIGVLQFILGLKELWKAEKSYPDSINAGTTKITVKSDGVVVKKNDKVTTQLRRDKKTSDSLREIRILFQDIKVDPVTCNGLSVVQESEVQMRLRISKDSPSSSDNVFSQMDEYNVLMDGEIRSLRQASVELHCKMCLENITGKIQFDRVLELPSELWQQTSLNLCCHGTISNLPSLQEGSLNPAERDCLLGSYFIMVHLNAIKSKHLDTKNSKVIKCSRCGWPIGDKVIQNNGIHAEDLQVKYIRINKHAVTTALDTDSNIFRAYTTEIFLSRLLQLKLQGRVNFKFLVKSLTEKETKMSCAILWILNPSAAVLTNVNPKPSKYMEEQQSNDNTNETEAKLINGIKILYKVLAKSTDKQIKTLPGVANMETLVLPQEQFVHLVLLLTGSTYTMPPSQRQVEGFNVGYLKT